MNRNACSLFAFIFVANIFLYQWFYAEHSTITPVGSVFKSFNHTKQHNEVRWNSSHPMTKVVFLKTHKTGSESVSGILRRYATLHNVSTLMSTNINGGHLYHTGSDRFAPVNEHVKMAGYGKPGAHFEMIATHMTWNKTFVDQIIPKRQRLTFTILRNPTNQLESSWKFYYPFFDKRGKIWPKQRTDTAQTKQLYTLLKNPLKFFKQANKLPRNHRNYLLRNQLSSFGFGDDIYKLNITKEEVREWISLIEKEFDLVMITEYFDYSLALLALELRWPLEELAFLRSNEGKRVKVKKAHNLDETIRIFNYPEVMLYEHFNATLWNKIKQIGLERVDEIANKIQSLSHELENECVEGYNQIRLANGKYAKEAISRNESSLKCTATVLWGRRQSDLLLARQKELIRKEHWSGLCGEAGIDEAACHSFHCCWVPTTNIGNGSHCFKPEIFTSFGNSINGGVPVALTILFVLGAAGGFYFYTKRNFDVLSSVDIAYQDGNEMN